MHLDCILALGWLGLSGLELPPLRELKLVAPPGNPLVQLGNDGTYLELWSSSWRLTLTVSSASE